MTAAAALQLQHDLALYGRSVAELRYEGAGAELREVDRQRIPPEKVRDFAGCLWVDCGGTPCDIEALNAEFARAGLPPKFEVIRRC